MEINMPHIRFASFNIGAAAKREEHFTPETLRDVAVAIRGSDADIVCLQEVDQCVRRSEGVDMPQYLADESGLEYYYFIKIRDFQGGCYGTAILSRYPLSSGDTYFYPQGLAKWGTSAGSAVAEVPGGALRVFNSHLSCEDDVRNTETMERYADYMRSFGGRFVAAADFNTDPVKIAAHMDFVRPVNLTLATFRNKNIDNILVTPDIQASAPWVIDTSADLTSDHRMLLCELEY